jgi:hypothetical protein
VPGACAAPPGAPPPPPPPRRGPSFYFNARPGWGVLPCLEQAAWCGAGRFEVRPPRGGFLSRPRLPTHSQALKIIHAVHSLRGCPSSRASRLPRPPSSPISLPAAGRVRPRSVLPPPRWRSQVYKARFPLGAGRHEDCCTCGGMLLLGVDCGNKAKRRLAHAELLLADQGAVRLGGGCASWCAPGPRGLLATAIICKLPIYLTPTSCALASAERLRRVHSLYSCRECGGRSVGRVYAMRRVSRASCPRSRLSSSLGDWPSCSGAVPGSAELRAAREQCRAEKEQCAMPSAAAVPSLAFDSRWVPPVGGAPSRHTRTGGAADGAHDQHLTRGWGVEWCPEATSSRGSS